MIEEHDDLYQEARTLVITEGKAMTSFLQRKLRIGYSRSARLMDELEDAGVIGAENGAKPREVLAKSLTFADVVVKRKKDVEEIEKKVGEATEPEVITEGYGAVVVNEDFSFIGKDGKKYQLEYKQKLFADNYLEMRGDRIEAIIEAGYDINYKNNKGEDTGTPNRQLCSVMAYELLTLPHVTSYINAKMAEFGFNAENVEEQHLFLLNQHGDLRMKGKAIDMYYKVNGRYPKEVKGDVNINVFSLAELAERSHKRKQLNMKPIAIEAVVVEPEVPQVVAGDSREIAENPVEVEIGKV